MHPIICKIGPFTVYSYGLMLVVAFFVASLLAGRQARRQGINSEKMLELAFIVFISGIIGARLLYVIENTVYYMKNPLEIIMLQHGGLSWFGGLFLGIACGIAYSKKHKLPVPQTLDLVAPYLALGQAIGRIGCLLNGCCFGSTVVPIQVTSGVILILIFVILRFLQEKLHQEGEIFFAYLLLYSLKRFFIEFFRQDNEVIFFSLTLFQVLSIAAFIIGAIGLLKSKIKKSKFNV